MSKKHVNLNARITLLPKGFQMRTFGPFGETKNAQELTKLALISTNSSKINMNYCERSCTIDLLEEYSILADSFTTQFGMIVVSGRLLPWPLTV